MRFAASRRAAAVKTSFARGVAVSFYAEFSIHTAGCCAIKIGDLFLHLASQTLNKRGSDKKVMS